LQFCEIIMSGRMFVTPAAALTVTRPDTVHKSRAPILPDGAEGTSEAVPRIVTVPTGGIDPELRLRRPPGAVSRLRGKPRFSPSFRRGADRQTDGDRRRIRELVDLDPDFWTIAAELRGEWFDARAASDQTNSDKTRSTINPQGNAITAAVSQ
jgi:hypothetical protein